VKMASTPRESNNYLSEAFALQAIGVLNVEDEFLVWMDAVDFLGAFGFTVHEAANADER
jgi:hypothetical protein